MRFFKVFSLRRSKSLPSFGELDVNDNIGDNSQTLNSGEEEVFDAPKKSKSWIRCLFGLKRKMPKSDANEKKRKFALFRLLQKGSKPKQRNHTESVVSINSSEPTPVCIKPTSTITEPLPATFTELVQATGISERQFAIKTRQMKEALSTVLRGDLSFYKEIRDHKLGSFGIVYTAKDKRFGDKLIALKRLSVGLQDWNLIVNEVLFMMNVKHANLMEATECFIVNSTKPFGPYCTSLYVSMEYMMGGNLNQFHRMKSLTEMQMGIVMREILCGLSYMHSNSYVHRDVKGDNILISYNGSVKLSDFGVTVNLKKDSEAMTDCNFGTTCYMAPELASYLVNKTDDLYYNGKVDVWSLGVVVMELVDGLPLFFDEFQANKKRNLRVVFELIANVKNPEPRNIDSYSDQLKDFCRRCLVSDQMYRHSSLSLREHPFITKNDGPTSLLREHVEFVREHPDNRNSTR